MQVWKLKFKVVVPSGLPINLFDEGMIDVLVEQGLKAVYFPLESGSKYVQTNIIKKRVNLSRAICLIKYAKQKGLFVGINIVLGFPGETKEMINETYNFIKNLSVDWIAFFTAYPYPETRMTRTLLERGDLTEDGLMEVWESSMQNCRERTFDTLEFTGQELSDLISDFNIRLNFFSSYNFKVGNYYDALKMLNKVIDKFSFHIVALACRIKCYRKLDKKQDTFCDINNIENLIKNNIESEKLFKKYKEEVELIINEGYNRT